MNDETERSLISKFQGGDSAAFGTLLEAHQNRVIHMGLQILRNEESALDVAQEVFMKFIKHFRKNREVRIVGGLLTT